MYIGVVTAQFSVQTDHPSDVLVAFHYRSPAAKGFANINCADSTANPYPADPRPCSGSFSEFARMTPTLDDDTHTPVPMGAMGGFGLSALLALGCYVTQASKRRAARTPC